MRSSPWPGMVFLPKIIIRQRRRYKEEAVLGPLLDTHQMKYTKASTTAPDLKTRHQVSIALNEVSVPRDEHP